MSRPTTAAFVFLAVATLATAVAAQQGAPSAGIPNASGFLKDYSLLEPVQGKEGRYAWTAPDAELKANQGSRQQNLSGETRQSGASQANLSGETRQSGASQGNLSGATESGRRSGQGRFESGEFEQLDRDRTARTEGLERQQRMGGARAGAFEGGPRLRR